jgi:hypothetical protein
MKLKIPKTFELMGRKIKVEVVPDLKAEDGEAVYGLAHWGEGWIKLRAGMEETALMHSFYHEIQHLVFEAIGRTRLSRNEELVDSLGGLWMQAIQTQKGNLFPRKKKIEDN